MKTLKMGEIMLNSSKITSDHLSRRAIVYIRQSTFKQTIKNLESQRSQYSLSDHAKEYGWNDIEIIDEDLGHSAGAGSRRTGFKKLLSAVASGDVGIIFSREASRLSRTDKDWCQLLEICRLFGTIIGDGSSVYDVNLMDDQLILGIKGTLSVAELSVMRTRLLQGQEQKAKRGELYKLVAPGYVCLDGKTLTKDPNQRVQEAISLVFQKFRELASARQVMKWLHEENIELPVNKTKNGKMQLFWQLPTYDFVKFIIKNPIYAGVYFHGRRQTKLVLDGDNGLRKKNTSQDYEFARVFIRDHHEPYISWAMYEEHKKMIRANNHKASGHDEVAAAVRGGHGLLAGLLRCGRCGRRLHIRYWGKSGTAARYLCVGDFGAGGTYCIGFGGATVDRRISEEILKVVEPLSIEASLKAIESLGEKSGDKKRYIELQIKQIEYETAHAFEQYNRVDPRNRLVADQLEKNWNDKLTAQQTLRDKLASVDSEIVELSSQERQNIMELGNRFPDIWSNLGGSVELKKKIIKILVREIIVNLNDDTQDLQFIIHWHGGCHNEITMPKPLSAAKKHKTSVDDIELIRKMAVRYNDGEIARVLSKLGRKTGKGKRWNISSVEYVRNQLKIPSTNPESSDQDVLNLAQATKYAGASDTTIMKLIRKGILPYNQIAPYAPLEIKKSDLDTKPVRAILQHLKESGILHLEGEPLTMQRPLFE